MSILTPWDWQQLVRQTSKKYKVYNMELEDFKNFQTLYTGKEAPFLSRKIDIEKILFRLSKCVQLQVRREQMGQLFFKTSFEGEFTQVDLVRSRRIQRLPWPTFVPYVTNEKIPINTSKYNDLMSLLPYLPTVCHDYYKNLPNTNNVHEYPSVDDDDDDESIQCTAFSH